MYYLLLDMIFFTLPEMLFITAITYIFLKRYDFLDIFKPISTLKNLFVPAFLAAFVLNLFEMLNLLIVNQILSLVILFISTFIILNKNSYQKVIRQAFKLLGCILAGLFISVIIETICMFILIYVLKIDAMNLLDNVKNYSLKIVTSLSWMIVELTIVILLYMKKNNKFSVIINVILKNKSLLKTTTFLLLINSITVFETIKLVLVNNIFSQTPIIEQIGVVLGVCLVLPTLFILLINIIVMLLINKEKQLQQLYQETDLNS
jgi:hypothetical protein